MKIKLFLFSSLLLLGACSSSSKSDKTADDKTVKDEVVVDNSVAKDEFIEDSGSFESEDDGFEEGEVEADSVDDEFVDDSEEAADEASGEFAEENTEEAETSEDGTEKEVAEDSEGPFEEVVPEIKEVKKVDKYAPSIHGLIRSARVGTREMCRVYLSKGVNINGQNKAGETPLHAALMAGRWWIAKFLLEQKAQVDIKDVRGITARGLIMESGNDELIQMIQSQK